MGNIRHMQVAMMRNVKRCIRNDRIIRNYMINMNYVYQESRRRLEVREDRRKDYLITDVV